MNFRPQNTIDELDINLIPLIDVLLVILIFLAATTTFSRYSHLEVNLPQARADATTGNMINVTISRDGIYAMDGRLLSGNTTEDIALALQAAAQENETPVIVVAADAEASHESVVRVMEAARSVRIEKINFATQSTH